jgi:hypothetical protein
VSHHKLCTDQCHKDCWWYHRPLPKPEPVKDPGVEVRDSPIHGKGVFSTKWWKPGELIGIYEGVLVTDSNDPHVLWLQDEEERYFGIMATGPMGYLNCSKPDQNNALLCENSPFIYARRNILPGDEILISYEFAEEDDDEDEDEEE